MKSPRAPRPLRRAGRLEWALSPSELPAAQAAAYALLDRACTAFCRRGGKTVLVAWPRGGKSLAALEAELLLECENERLRAALAAEGSKRAPELLRRLLAGSAEEPGPGPAPAALAPERRAEIAAALAETPGGRVEDPLGIKATWDSRRGGAKS